MDSYLAWLWFAAAVLLGLIELHSGTFIFLLFALACFATGVAALLGASLAVQSGLLLAGTLASLAAAPALVKRLRRTGPALRFGVDALLDQQALVTEAVDPLHGTGAVKVGGAIWRARASAPIPAGTLVRIAEVDGTKLVVYPDPQAAPPERERLLDADSISVQELNVRDQRPRDG
ncbi:MAG: NfeD family protein [Armatimonadetes bacterium]|nr:NfeD family protein [Armatimonadota bacterium]